MHSPFPAVDEAPRATGRNGQLLLQEALFNPQPAEALGERGLGQHAEGHTERGRGAV